MSPAEESDTPRKESRLCLIKVGSVSRPQFPTPGNGADDSNPLVMKTT